MSTKLLILILIAFQLNTAKAQEREILLEEIIVNDKSSLNIISPEIIKDSSVIIAPRTAGDIFKNIPGFNITKRSNYAIEPSLRMYRNEQLKLMMDGGTQITQSCANRMDPMTSRISSGEIEKIEIIKGPYGVRFGQNFGGIVNIITERPKASEEFKIKGSLEGGYEVNGDGKSTILTLSGANKLFDVFVNGSYRDFGNYESGDGTEIVSSFTAYDYSVKLGVNPTEKQRLQLAWRQSFADNIMHAGLPMDALSDEGTILSLDYSWKAGNDFLKAINAKVYGSWVDHLMSNQWKATVKNTLAISGVESTTYGSKLEFVSSPNEKIMLYSGIDYKFLNKDGTRDRTMYINPCSGAVFLPKKHATDLLWQNSSTEDYGVFAEIQYFSNPRMTVKTGLRADFININVANASPDFEVFYGADLQPGNHTTFNAFANLNYKISEKSNLQFSVGKGARTPDLLELFINHFSVGKDAYEYVGNPNLVPEKNMQSDLAFSTKGKKNMVYTNIFYAFINDYITAIVDETIPRKFTPCAEPAFAKRFVNIDEVFQYGFEFGFDVNLAKNFNIKGDMNYTYAQNIDWNEPVAEIAPFSSNLSFIYKTTKFKTELSGRFVSAQERTATSFGETNTDGFQTFKLGFQYNVKQLARIGLEIDNLLNENYYEHLSRPYKSMTEKMAFYETGRNIKFSVKFMF